MAFPQPWKARGAIAPLMTESSPQWQLCVFLAVDEGRDRGAGTLSVCYAEAAGPLGRDAEEKGQQTTRVPAQWSRPLYTAVWCSL
ncbi:hypothetical protein Y032_0116g583 [Ancylostoma ceylanicum]|nr:hypothetical protein Y032_0116g583 [Ancylostoma ceylanicum]